MIQMIAMSNKSTIFCAVYEASRRCMVNNDEAISVVMIEWTGIWSKQETKCDASFLEKRQY